MIEPDALNFGQFMKEMATPINPNVLFVYDYLIWNLLWSIFPLIHKIHIINEHNPLYKNIESPPPPSKVFNPYIIIAEFKQYPMAIIGGIRRYICQKENNPIKSSTVITIARQAYPDLDNNEKVIWKKGSNVLKDVKQLSQKVAKSIVVWVPIDILSNKLTNAKIDNFLKGQYIKVKPNRRVNTLLTKLLLIFVNELESLVLAKVPINNSANTWKTITTIIIICIVIIFLKLYNKTI